MINLAPYKYKDLIRNKEIIDEIIQYEIQLIDNKKFIETLVKLNKNLKPDDIFESQIYSNYDGSGTSLFKNNSIYKALSEAIERWAFYCSSEDCKATECGFIDNPSTCGMATYPELFPFNSLKNAKNEAYERFSIHAFNRGNLPVVEIQSSIANLQIYEIINGEKKQKVVILKYDNGSYFTYSFACKEDLKLAIKHALVELSRNIRVLKKYYENPIPVEKLEISDRRLVYYSTEEGCVDFLEKIKSSPSKILEVPKLICNKELKGPWSKYAITWRYLFANSYEKDSTNIKFFMF